MSQSAEPQAARYRDELLALNNEYCAITGGDYYLYTSIPGDGQVKVVFHGTQCNGYAAGMTRMKARLREAS